MSIQDVEDTLENENELLRAMVAFVRYYPNDHFTGSGKTIQKSWADFLLQRSDTNQNVAGVGKKQTVGLEKDMEAERTQLEAYIAVSDVEHKKYGRFPAYSPPFRTVLGYQAGHVDIEFYDKFYREEALSETQRQHNERWHS